MPLCMPLCMPICVQSDMAHWPFKVISGPAEKPMVEGEGVSEGV